MSIFNILFQRTKMPNLKLLLNNESFKNFLSKAENISIGYSELKIFSMENIHKVQKAHQNRKNKGWKKNWIIIGTDYLDDFLFVDCKNLNLLYFRTRKQKMETD